MAYTITDVMNTLAEDQKMTLDKLDRYITTTYSPYAPFDIKEKASHQWVINYRKKPKIGKPICNILTDGNQLSIQFIFLTEMTREVFIKLSAFTEKTQATIKQCCRCKACYGPEGCQWRQYFIMSNHLFMSCPYPYVLLDDISSNDIDDIITLIDLQMKHMSQDAKEIKGNLYLDENLVRCKAVTAVMRPVININSTISEQSQHKAQVRLHRYAHNYHLIMLGEHEGTWYYHNDELFYNNIEKSAVDKVNITIPEGQYAMVTVTDPLSFSFFRAVNHILRWATREKHQVRNVNLSETIRTITLTRFYCIDNVNYMDIYVPIL